MPTTHGATDTAAGVRARRQELATGTASFTPGFTRPLRARGAPHPGHHGRSRGPGCGDQSDAPGGPDPPPCAGYRTAYIR